MIAHVSGVPVEELLPLALASGTGLAAYARARLRGALKRENRPRGAA
jgi:hypothetical protein